MPSVLSIFADESGEWGKRSEYYLITLVFHDQSKDISLALERYRSRWLTMDFLMSLSMLGRCLPGMMLTKG